MKHKCEKCGGSVEDTCWIKPMAPPINIFCCKNCLEVYCQYNQHESLYSNEYYPDGELRCMNYKKNYWCPYAYPKTEEDFIKAKNSGFQPPDSVSVKSKEEGNNGIN